MLGFAPNSFKLVDSKQLERLRKFHKVADLLIVSSNNLINRPCLGVWVEIEAWEGFRR